MLPIVGYARRSSRIGGPTSHGLSSRLCRCTHTIASVATTLLRRHTTIILANPSLICGGRNCRRVVGGVTTAHTKPSTGRTISSASHLTEWGIMCMLLLRRVPRPARKWWNCTTYTNVGSADALALVEPGRCVCSAACSCIWLKGSILVCSLLHVWCVPWVTRVRIAESGRIHIKKLRR